MAGHRGARAATASRSTPTWCRPPRPRPPRPLAALDGAVPDLAAASSSAARSPTTSTPPSSAPASCPGRPRSLGCSAPGVIGGGRGVELTSAVSVWAAALPGVALRSFHLEVLRTSDSHRGRRACRCADTDDRVAVLLADPYSFPVDAFVEQAAEALPGLPLVRRQRRRPARRRRRPGCSSTACVHDRGAVGLVLGGDARAPRRW